MSATAVASQISSNAWAAGLPTRGPGADACASIPGVAGLLLRYVAPLRDLFDDLLGDPAQVSGFAMDWEGVSRSLVQVENDLQGAQRAISELDGRTARALRKRHEDLAALSRDTAEWCAATASALRLASEIVAAVRLFVCDLLVQLSRLGEALFGGFTLNPVEVWDRVEDFADAARDLVVAATRLADQLVEALFALASLLQRLVPLVAERIAEVRETIAQMLPAIGFAIGQTFGPVSGLLGLLGGGALENFLANAPQVNELDPDDLTEEQRDAWKEAMGITSLTTLSDLVGVNGTTDRIGGSDRTAIDIKKVRGPDGTYHWVVSLPSTQDWQLGPDAGALNDRDSNLALMMDNPLLRSQYERVVLEAMRDAGVPPGGDVVLTGFSQGGIMAANLAADRSFPYNPIGVVTNGSPIDSFDIPQNVPVYAFEHATDPVPMLDGKPYGLSPVPGGVPRDTTPPNVNRVILPDPPGHHVAGAHDNARYVASIKDWERAGGGADVAQFGGTVVDHSVFATAER